MTIVNLDQRADLEWLLLLCSTRQELAALHNLLPRSVQRVEADQFDEALSVSTADWNIGKKLHETASRPTIRLALELPI